MRKIIAVLALLMMIATASGMSFGSFVSNNQKTVQGSSAEFYINVMNLGENPLELSIEARNADTGSIRAPSEIILQPSQVTDNPSQNIDDDEEWLLLDDGKYVKTRKIPVIFVAEEGTGHDFTIDISATPSDTFLNQNGEEYATAQRVVQSRSYDFTVATSSSTSTSSPTNEDENSDTTNQQNNDQQSSLQSTASDFVRETVENTRDTLGLGSEDESTNDNEGAENTGTDQTNDAENQESEQSSEGDQENSDSSATGSFFSQAASNPVTTTLMTGVVISVGYLITVLL